MIVFDDMFEFIGGFVVWLFELVDFGIVFVEGFVCCIGDFVWCVGVLFVLVCWVVCVVFVMSCVIVGGYVCVVFVVFV